MARTRRNELMAGTFVLAAAAVIILVVGWLGGVRLGGRFAYITAPLGVGDVSIVEGSEVKLSTVVVGKVDRVSPASDWQSFTFRLRLSRDVDLRQDAVIEAVAPTLGGVGLLSVLHTGSLRSPAADVDHPVRLSLGTSPMIRDLQRQLGYGPAERQTLQQAIADMGRSLSDLALVAGSLRTQLVASDQPNMVSTATETLTILREIATDIEQDLSTLRAQLDPANAVGAMGKVHHTLDNATQASDEAAAMMRTIRPDIEQAVARTAATAEKIELYTRTDLAELLATLRSSGNELLAMLSEFHEMSSAARRIVMVNNGNIDEMIDNLTQVSVNLKVASRDIRRHPWKLLGPPSANDPRSENIQDAAEAFSQGATQLDDAIQRLETLREIEGKDLPADDPELELVRQRIRDSFEHFTRVEQALWEEISQ